jgi:uncharacterized protein YecE (DUF72 family)
MPDVAGTLYLGTSGFAYAEWKGPFYPPKLKQREMLPAEKTLATWRDATPDGFLFALKAHQRITHWMRLEGADEAVTTFLDRVRVLSPRLGPILFQCPPTLKYDRSLIESFLAFLPPTFRYAFEFRHPSWQAAKAVLASQGAAWCVAETDETPVTEDVIPSEPFVFLRLRKTEYSDEGLAAWNRRVDGPLARGVDVFCYFKHEEKGAGPVLAERMAKLAGVQGAETASG